MPKLLDWELVRASGRVNETNWCCSGPFPMADCEHVLSHYHSDCTLCPWNMKDRERWWAPTFHEAAQKLLDHVAAVHGSGKRDKFGTETLF